MGKRATRRSYRRMFRRVRIYLPLVFAVLAAMVLFLPLSAGWMARKAAREISAATGLDVTLERLEITVARAKVEAIGVTVGERAERPFRIGRVELDGSLASLLSGEWAVAGGGDGGGDSAVAAGEGQGGSIRGSRGVQDADGGDRGGGEREAVVGWRGEGRFVEEGDRADAAGDPAECADQRGGAASGPAIDDDHAGPGGGGGAPGGDESVPGLGGGNRAGGFAGEFLPARGVPAG
jgi:hypothetical protein